jgi:putative ATP-binding cassette transporter
MKLVKFLLRYSRGAVIAAIFAGVVSGVGSTALLALINATLTGQGLSRPSLGWMFLGFCLVVPVSRIVSELLLAQLGQGTVLDLRVRLSRRILGVPQRQLEEMGAHRLLNLLLEDVPAISNVVVQIPVLCINVSVILGCLIYLGWLSWQALLAVLLFMALGIATYQWPLARALRHLESAREQEDRLTGHLRGLTEGSKELKLHRERREAFLSRVLRGTAQRVWKHNIDGLRIYTFASSWGQLLVFVVVGLVLFVLPRIQTTGHTLLTGYAMVLLYLMGPLQMVMNALPTLGRAGVSIRRIEEMGEALASYAEDEPKAAAPPAPALAPWSSLALDGVTHSYRREGEESSFVLGPVDLEFRPGELVFIAGGNGSGKTTLAKLITGLYVPESGAIRFDGRPVDDESRDAYRQQFSAVFSDFYLFDSLLGLDIPDLDAVARGHLERLQLAHKVRVENGELSTTELSQGQRKRLALLTAYLEDRPIYLFDEWAADQDPVFRDLFYYDILPALKARHKLVLAISHDDRYYELGDRLVKLTYGKVEHDGPFAALRAAAGAREPGSLWSAAEKAS